MGAGGAGYALPPCRPHINSSSLLHHLKASISNFNELSLYIVCTLACIRLCICTHTSFSTHSTASEADDTKNPPRGQIFARHQSLFSMPAPHWEPLGERNHFYTISSLYACSSMWCMLRPISTISPSCEKRCCNGNGQATISIVCVRSFAPSTHIAHTLRLGKKTLNKVIY